MWCPASLLQSFIWISLMATGVQYEVSHIVSKMCVVLQSTALIPCKYTSPDGKQVSAGEWLRENSSGQKVSVSQDPAFQGRVEFILSEGNCSLLLRDVRKSDEGLFHFMFTASGKNWTNAQGIRLEVTDAEVEIKTESDVVMEGDWVSLICGSCIPSMTVPTYTWRKDGHLHSKHHAENVLDLMTVRLEDEGQYFCIISGHEGLGSTHVNITVTPGYPPRSVSVSVSGSAEIVEGDSVTLSCSSDSKPPALTFSWFQENQTSAVGSGQTFIISSFNSSHSGRFYCEAQNKHGSQRSASVLLTVKESSSWISVTVGVSVSVVLTSVILMVFFRLFRRHNKTVESPEDAYMTLDLKTRCPEYDTLDNVKRSCENKDNPKDLPFNDR